LGLSSAACADQIKQAFGSND